MCGAHRDQKGALDPLEPELQVHMEPSPVRLFFFFSFSFSGPLRP